MFIVHGHNHVARTELKALLGGMGLRPVVLDEQDDRGLTINGFELMDMDIDERLLP